jgi:hypothetical protein
MAPFYAIPAFGALFACRLLNVLKVNTSTLRSYNMKSALIWTTLIVSAALSVCETAPVEAKQYQTSDGHVVHTRLAPVVAHRISPPFHGRHIYRRR